MKTPLLTLARAPLGLVYVTLIVLQRHRAARLGAAVAVLGALAGTCAVAIG